MERNARRYDAADYRNLHGSVIVQEIAGTEIGVRRFDEMCIRDRYTR